MITKKNIFRIFALSSLFLSPFFLQAQEFLTGLKQNSHIIKEFQKQEAQGNTCKSEKSPMLLPFFEDFSRYTGYPNQNLFIDKQAYVNNTFSIFAPTIGVVTLDALNQFGEIYSHLNTIPQGADTLTSRYIRLDSLFTQRDTLKITPADSVYFSFYFQPGGGGVLGETAGEFIGNQPDIEDSLVLEFAYMDTTGYTKWNHIWSTPGFNISKWTSVDSLKYFEQVMIPVDSLYLCNQFQFRFRNYASLEPQVGMVGWQGNVDQWHIDYIRLDVKRSYDDIFTQDLAFVSPTTSMLKKYQSMPWKQYRNEDIKSNFTNQLTNLNEFPATSEYLYKITRQNNLLSNYTYSCNIEPYHTNGIQPNTGEAARQSHPEIKRNDFPNSLTDTATFRITHIFYNPSAGNDFCPANDTCVFVQKFYDYYAYDDGSAEYGYCLNAPFGTASLAMQFSVQTPDSLRGVRMWFNHTKDDENKQASFDIIVWNDDNGKPGTERAKLKDQKPSFEGHFLDFEEYQFDKKQYLPAGTYWIGFKQHGNVQLNIGFDQNNDSRDFFRYNTQGAWAKSVLKGTPMIRPVFGTPVVPPLNINTFQSPTFVIFPNPTTGELRIENGELRIENVEIYDIYGKKISSYHHINTSSHHLNISHLSPGIYFIRIYKEDGAFGTAKLIKN